MNNPSQKGQSAPSLGRRAFFQAALGTTLVGVGSPVQETSPRQVGSRQSYRESLETPIVARHQVVVAGGGPSGIIAALAATRSGADTLLLER